MVLATWPINIFRAFKAHAFIFFVLLKGQKSILVQYHYFMSISYFEKCHCFYINPLGLLFKLYVSQLSVLNASIFLNGDNLIALKLVKGGWRYPLPGEYPPPENIHWKKKPWNIPLRKIPPLQKIIPVENNPLQKIHPQWKIRLLKFENFIWVFFP